ncbi:zinc-binding dehydrogenase [Streptomyces seoulensis]|uniref:zinc-binding dehydrogenase n=1 Tax=Streptomyces seoulensis TaxID=73044 RepID=UPI0033A4B097
MPLPFIPGKKVVGTSDGQRVAALMRGGGYAQVSRARVATTFSVPDDVDDDTAPALTLQGQSAWHLLHTVLRVRAGETVIVPAAGRVGSLAVQLAKRVVAMAGSPEKRSFATDLGADAVVDSRSANLAEALAEAADGLFAAVRSGDPRVPPVTVYPLTEAARAQDDLRARRTVGKVALDPAN